MPLPVSGTVNNLKVRIDDNYGTGRVTFTVEKSSGTADPANTALACTITGPGGSSTNTTDQMCGDVDSGGDVPHYETGDRLSFKVYMDGQAVNRRMSMCVTFEAD